MRHLFAHIKIIKANHFCIHSGRFGGRRLHFPNVRGLRPTPAIIRETLFDWIQFEIEGRDFLDLFSGSGSLGFEALSRGANFVLSVEKNHQACAALKKNQQLLGADNHRIMCRDVHLFLKQKSARIFDFISLDPPFAKNDIPRVLAALGRNFFVAAGSKIYLESAFKIEPKFLLENDFKNAEIIKQKQVSIVHATLLEMMR